MLAVQQEAGRYNNEIVHCIKISIPGKLEQKEWLTQHTPPTKPQLRQHMHSNVLKRSVNSDYGNINRGHDSFMWALQSIPSSNASPLLVFSLRHANGTIDDCHESLALLTIPCCCHWPLKLDWYSLTVPSLPEVANVMPVMSQSKWEACHQSIQSRALVTFFKKHLHSTLRKTSSWFQHRVWPLELHDWDPSLVTA